MIPDLGKYYWTVLSAYGVSIAILAVLVGFYLWRSKRVKADLKRIEDRKNG